MNRFNLPILVLAFLYTQFLPKAHAQEDDPLFTYTSLEREDIRDTQVVQEKLKAIRFEPVTVRIYIVKINFGLLNSLNSKAIIPDESCLQKPYSLHLTSPMDGNDIKFNEVCMVKGSQSKFKIQGKNTETPESVNMNVYSDKKIVLGYLFDGFSTYFIQPLEGDVHTLTEIDGSDFPLDMTIPIFFRRENKNSE